MNKALWIARKNYLCHLIKKVSEQCGGDEIEFLRRHCREVIESHPDEKIEEAINCYETVLVQIELNIVSIKIETNPESIKLEENNEWNYRTPFHNTYKTNLQGHSASMSL